MSKFISSQRGWLVVEPLPAYAPELNPVEALWANLKGTELANLDAETLDQTVRAARAGVERVRRRRGLASSFLRRTGFSL